MALDQFRKLGSALARHTGQDEGEGSVCLTKPPNFYSVEKGREEGVADPLLDISTPPGSVRTRLMSRQEGAHRHQLNGQLYQVRATITALFLKIVERSM